MIMVCNSAKRDLADVIKVCYQLTSSSSEEGLSRQIQSNI